MTDICSWQKHLQTLPDKIAEMYRIRRLDVSYNDLNENSFPPQLMHIRSITQLISYYNRLNHLPEFILEYKWLRTLNISNNQIKDIPFGLRHLKQLENLAVENNPLPKRYIESIEGHFRFYGTLGNFERKKEANPVLQLATAEGGEGKAPRSPRQLPNTPLVPSSEDKADMAKIKQPAVEDSNRKYVYNKRK